MTDFHRLSDNINRQSSTRRYNVGLNSQHCGHRDEMQYRRPKLSEYNDR